MLKSRLAARLLPPRPRASDYNGASLGRRLLFWNPGGSSVNAIISAEGDTLTQRGRDSVRNNGWASEISEEWTANCVGAGITPQFLHPTPGIRKILTQNWQYFVDRSDLDGMQDLYGLQTLACREMIEGSESLTRLVRVSAAPRDPGLRLQMLESEHLPRTKNETAANGNVIRCGIEFAGVNKSARAAYHLYPEHPGAGFTAREQLDGMTQRIPASEIVHCFRVLRSGQFRGEPWLSRTLPKLYQFDQFVDATLGRQKLGAYLFGWLKSQAGTAGFPVQNTLSNGQVADSGTTFSNIEPDTVVKLGLGEELEFFKQPDISTQYESFVNLALRDILAGAGMTLEQFDVSKVNYSSIRAGMLKFRRRCEQIQFHVLIFQFCRPIVNAWMDALVLSGQTPIQINDYLQNRHLYQAVEWRTPRWAWVDPLKDTLAVIAEIRSGLKTLSQAIRELGYDPEQVFQERSEELKRFRDLGLVFDSDPSQTTQSGQTTALMEALITATENKTTAP